MLGVVIWTDDLENKAIVWCEDHGDLAFLGQSSNSNFVTEKFDRGDLIQFDLAEQRNLRMAKNPRRIAQHYCSDLSAVLDTAQHLHSNSNYENDPEKGDVISFEDAKQSRECSQFGASLREA